MGVIRPLDGENTRDFWRRIFGELPDTVTVVVTYPCSQCGRSHVAEIATTANAPESVVSILTLGILEVIDTYSLVGDDEYRREVHPLLWPRGAVALGNAYAVNRLDSFT